MSQSTFTVELGQWFQRLNWGRIIELFLTWLILLITLPAGVVFAVIIKLQDRGPIFYQGTRLGKDRKLFTIYKLRTLVIDAEQIIGNNLYDPSQKLTTPIGVFLRDTHFDELPQLWCVIKGDMALIGRGLNAPPYMHTCVRKFLITTTGFALPQAFWDIRSYLPLTVQASEFVAILIITISSDALCFLISPFSSKPAPSLPNACSVES